MLDSLVQFCIAQIYGASKTVAPSPIRNVEDVLITSSQKEIATE